MHTDARFLKPLIEGVLRDYQNHSWSIQGFGMIRTYLGPKSDPKRFRLNIWDRRFAVTGVSTIHDHPWHFDSVIVAGAFCNVRYNMNPKIFPERNMTHSYIDIKTGPGGGYDPNVLPGTCLLVAERPEIYAGGDVYHQEASEIHESLPYDGTVTFNERRRVGDGEHARVFWPYGEKWVSAEPREARTEDIHLAIRDSLERWFQ
jgi:hypothetical protein